MAGVTLVSFAEADYFAFRSRLVDGYLLPDAYSEWMQTLMLKESRLLHEGKLGVRVQVTFGEVVARCELLGIAFNIAACELVARGRKVEADMT